MSAAEVYDRPVNDKAAALIARAALRHYQLVKARERAEHLQQQRNASLLAAWREGAEMSELAQALGISTQAVSKALGRPTGRTWHVAGTGKPHEAVSDGE